MVARMGHEFFVFLIFTAAEIPPISEHLMKQHLNLNNHDTLLDQNSRPFLLVPPGMMTTGTGTTMMSSGRVKASFHFFAGVLRATLREEEAEEGKKKLPCLKFALWCAEAGT